MGRLLSEQEMTHLENVIACDKEWKDLRFISDQAMPDDPDKYKKFNDYRICEHLIVAKAQDAKSISARDKEWVAGISQTVRPLKSCSDDECKSSYETLDKVCFEEHCCWWRWQQLKKDMGVKE